ncbi:twin-arginine translocation signal domain-containing protein [Oceanimonas sp. NS1]|nr:twin-arginine translocation signal domain-containing protein [Oceanimonas sp. NS1]
MQRRQFLKGLSAAGVLCSLGLAGCALPSTRQAYLVGGGRRAGAIAMWCRRLTWTAACVTSSPAGPGARHGRSPLSAAGGMPCPPTRQLPGAVQS